MTAVRRMALAMFVVVGFWQVDGLADATLVNLDAPARSPGSFWVIFKSPKELAAIPKAQLDSLSVLPGILPTTEKNVLALGEALSAKVHGRFGGTTFPAERPAFSVGGVSDDDVIHILAKDPRVAEIGANLQIGTPLAKPHDPSRVHH